VKLFLEALDEKRGDVTTRRQIVGPRTISSQRRGPSREEGRGKREERREKRRQERKYGQRWLARSWACGGAVRCGKVRAGAEPGRKVSTVSIYGIYDPGPALR
jgi:hypothetical protein